LYFFFGIWLLFLLEHVFCYTKNIRELSIRAVRAESETQKAKLESIKSRLNPHFLYNSLNAISGLVVSGKRDEAADAIGRLGELLRETLEHQGENFVKLEQELEIVGHYISVIKYRFGDKVRFVEKVDHKTSQLRIPSMLLLPIIENAIKHGLGRNSGEVTIRLEAENNEKCVNISVTSFHADKSAKDNGTSGFGIGLSSIRERLEILYSKDANMLVIEENGTFKVLLTLPLEPPEIYDDEQE
ncbi:MAG: histidine kinase, partial [candidate division Zixibacteria bacterium]